MLHINLHLFAARNRIGRTPHVITEDLLAKRFELGQGGERWRGTGAGAREKKSKETVRERLTKWLTRADVQFEQVCWVEACNK